MHFVFCNFVFHFNELLKPFGSLYMGCFVDIEKCVTVAVTTAVASFCLSEFISTNRHEDLQMRLYNKMLCEKQLEWEKLPTQGTG